MAIVSKCSCFGCRSTAGHDTRCCPVDTLKAENAELEVKLQASKALIESYMRACRCVEEKGKCCVNCSETEKGWDEVIAKQALSHEEER